MLLFLKKSNSIFTFKSNFINYFLQIITSFIIIFLSEFLHPQNSHFIYKTKSIIRVHA